MVVLQNTDKSLSGQSRVFIIGLSGEESSSLALRDSGVTPVVAETYRDGKYPASLLSARHYNVNQDELINTLN